MPLCSLSANVQAADFYSVKMCAWRVQDRKRKGKFGIKKKINEIKNGWDHLKSVPEGWFKLWRVTESEVKI